MARGAFRSLDIGAADAVLEELQGYIAAAPAKARKTAQRVLRRGLKRGESRASANIRADLALKKKVVDERISSAITSSERLEGVLLVRDRRVELIEFMTRNQIATAWRRQNARQRRSAGVTIKLRKSEGRKLFRGMFVNVGLKSGKWHVMEREQGHGRYPAYIRYGPSVLDEFDIVKAANEAAEYMNSEMLRLFEKNVDIT